MPTFDIVSKTDMQEVDNAIGGITREIAQRFDFKGSKCSVTRKEVEITILADDDFKLKQVHDLIATYFTRRKVDPRFLDYKTPESASGGTLRQIALVRQGIEQETAKYITKEIKGQKFKVQVAIQGDELRVSGKKRDDLQEVIAFCKELKKVEQPLQYVNFRD
ncbi:MAG: YajQ family cyclic di-GMP-binding protein [bacterium]|nr:YajQ family cyclic di-GMP-binding protein [bacterium]